MLFAAAISALFIGLFVLGSINSALADGLFPIVGCGLLLAAFAMPATRRACLDVITRYALALLVFAALAALLLWDAEGNSPHALGLAGTSDEAFQRIGFAFAAIVIAGVALAKGRRTVLNALLIGLIVLALLAIALRLQGRTDLFTMPAQIAWVFALLGLLAAFTVADALGRRSREDGRKRSRAERLFLPVAATTAGIVGLALTGTFQVAGGFAIGVAALAALLTTRERKGRLRPHFALVAAIAAIAGAALLYLAHRETGVPFLSALSWANPMTRRALGVLVVALVFIGRLALSNDRGRRPSRGAGLALAGLAFFLLAGAEVRAPSSLAALALVVGLAAAFADRLAVLNPDARNSGLT